MSDDAISLWIVMPAYNEMACLEQVVMSWLRAVDALGIADTTLLLVDDGSTDATPQIADDLARREARVCVLHQANAGHGAAVLSGYRRALAGGARWVFQTDSDEQMTPVDLASLWAGRKPDTVIVGYRAERQDPTSRKLISASLRLGLRLLFGVSVRDANVPYRLFAGSYLAALLAQLPRSMATPNVALSVLAARDRRLVEIPAHHGPRRSGRSTLVSGSLLRLCARSFAELWQVRRAARAGRTAAATPPSLG